MAAAFLLRYEECCFSPGGPVAERHLRTQTRIDGEKPDDGGLGNRSALGRRLSLTKTSTINGDDRDYVGEANACVLPRSVSEPVEMATKTKVEGSDRDFHPASVVLPSARV